MKPIKSLLFLAWLPFCMTPSAQAQTDMTSKLTNPDFESGFTGWTQVGMQTQTNDIFTKKNGTIFLEKWTGRGGAVGSCRVSQTVTGLPAGVYTLTAAAQNIQENTPSAAQTGAAIFAGSERTVVTVTADYSVRFAVASTSATTRLGFEAISASGNWIAVDHFRLQQETAGVEAAKAELKSTLQAAIETATQHLASGTKGKDSYEAAIAEAQTELNNAGSTATKLAAALETLRSADFRFQLDNATGTAPRVTTDTRYTVGSDIAYGRGTVSGVAESQLLEQGFCWSSVNTEPTVLDDRSTMSYDYNGKVYILPELTPATTYYVRAYAMTKGYAVGYGDVIKVNTIPRGTITWWYNNGADADANARINAALEGAVAYWNRLTSITGFGVSCNYGSGTPTADCGYGGGMRIGPNASYQRVGTVMHEMLHGIGVGTHSMWWNGEMRSAGDRGDWLGNRTSEVLRFWDNNTTGILTGDNTHMWPYGINGAAEDNGSDILYTVTSLLAEALGEDGLPPTWGAFATPAYVFPQVDNVKYYLKSEDEAYGRYSAYLREVQGNRIAWEEMDSETAQANDSIAWYVTYNAATRGYRFRNVATGHYITYSSTGTNGFRVTANIANLQLMKGRTDVDVAGKTLRGYWLLRPSAGDAPATLAASTNGAVAAETYNLAAASSPQRWLILTADQCTSFDVAYTTQARNQFNVLLKGIREVAATPHVERVPDVDADLSAVLADAESKSKVAGGSTLKALTANVRQAFFTFLAQVKPEQDGYFDLTFLLQNPGFGTDANGWAGEVPAVSESCAEFYEKTFNFSQTLADMPAGDYEVRVQAFQRPGEAAAALTAFNSTNNKVTTYLYANSKSQKVNSIAADRQQAALFNDGGWGSDIHLSDGTYVPNCMAGAAAYFKKNLYENVLSVNLSERADLRMGLRCSSSQSYYWTIFDNFRLHYFGNNYLVDGIAEAGKGDEEVNRPSKGKYYDLSGRRVSVSSARPVQPGIYVIDGKKVVVK